MRDDHMNKVSIDNLAQQLLELGVIPGGVLLVHTAFSKIGPVEDGPRGLIDALRTALGSDGTLVMPSMSWDDDRLFDPKTSPCPEMGAVADTFWRQSDVLRSDSPHAFASTGRLAANIVAPHPIDPPHGLDSPVGRVHEFDGQVLLLGVGHNANTTIHLAENLAGVRYRHDKYVTVLENGRPTRFEYREIDHCSQNFALIDAWLDNKHLQRRGLVGHGEARLSHSHDIVSVVLQRLRTNETIFLHPMGFDEDCDIAQGSLIGVRP